MHDQQTLEIIFIAVAAGALVLQTIFMIVIAVVALKAVRTVREEMDHYRSVVMPIVEKVTPIVEKTREVVDNLAPKVEEISTQLTTISKTLREQTADIQIAATDIIDRTRRQANRVDGMVTSVLNKFDRAGEVVANAFTKPVRQLSGIVSSVRAAVETLREQPSPAAPPAPPVPPQQRVVPARFIETEPANGPRPTGTTKPFRP